MKKLFLLFIFMSFGCLAQEMKEYDFKVKVQEFKGIEYNLYSTITRTDPVKNKTEYQFTLRWINTTEQDIYYLNSKFGGAHVASMTSYFWDLKGEDTGLKVGRRKVFVLKAGKTYQQHYFTKWFSEKSGALELLINIVYSNTKFANNIEELKK